MKLVETHEYKFPSHLLAPLVNGDPIIDEEDRKCFEEFIDKLERFRMEYGASHYMIDCSDIDYFSHTNCLSDVGCNVTDIRVHFIR